MKMKTAAPQYAICATTEYYGPERRKSRVGAGYGPAGMEPQDADGHFVGTRAECHAKIAQLESGRRYLAHNQASPSTYTIVRA
jgi:hypothetical protein